MAEDMKKLAIEQEEQKLEEEKKEMHSHFEFNCQKCPGAGFNTQEEYKAHFKSEWHVENVKRICEKKEMLDFQAFEFYKETLLDKELEEALLEKKSNNKQGGKKNKRKTKKQIEDEEW